MMKISFGIIAALLVAGTASAFAQEPAPPCNTYFTMYVFDQRIGLILAPGMTSDQSQWFYSKAKKKYPGFCTNTERATYVMVTFRWTENQERTVTKTESAVTTGPVTTVVGQSGGGPGQPAQPIWQTQLGTFVTTWKTQVNEIVHEPHAYILVFETKDGNPLSPKTELKKDPVLQAKGVGRNAGRDALEFVLQHWETKLKSCASGSTSTSCR
jgi:hypothetical protein